MTQRQIEALRYARGASIRPTPVTYADKLALIQKHLAQMEMALRSSAVQADLLAAA